MRVRFWLIPFLLCLAFSSFVYGAEPAKEVRQVSYQLQVVELSSSDAQILGIQLAEPSGLLKQGTGLITRFIQSPSLTTILQGALSLFEVTIEHANTKTAKWANPYLTIAVGESGKLVVSQEEWFTEGRDKALVEKSFGLELHLTPQQVDARSERVLTKVELHTASSANSLLTSVWTRSGELEALGVLSYETSFEYSKAETRYFAVYLEANPVETLSETPRVNLGSLGGLSDLLLQREMQKQPSSIQLILPFTPVAYPELVIDLWLSKVFRVELVTEPAYPHYHLDLGVALTDTQDLTANLQLFKDAGNMYLALGAVDRVRLSPEVTVAAGLYPIVFDLHEKKLGEDLYGWAEFEYSGAKLYASLLGQIRLEHKYWQATLGYRLNSDNLVFVRYKDNGESYQQLSIGYHLEF